MRQIQGTVLAFLLLLCAWETVARVYFRETPPLGLGASVAFDQTGNEDLPASLARIPPSPSGRILVLGSSQIRTVKGSESPEVSLPARLAARENLGGRLVIDLSTGGQQVIESSLLMLTAARSLEVDAVVLGLGIFSTQRITVREKLRRSLHQAPGLRSRLPAPGELPASLREALGEAPASSGGASVEKTVQDRIEERLADWVGGLRFVSRRQEMYEALVHLPLERDLAAWVKARVLGRRTSRTYHLPSHLDRTLETLEHACRVLREEKIPVLLALLPHNRNQDPVPYPPEEQERFREALGSFARESGIRLLDLGDQLNSAHFGSYQDGSPDGFHFTAEGHALLAAELAPALEELLTKAGGG